MSTNNILRQHDLRLRATFCKTLT